jgi:hypothetical protein
LSKFDIIRLSRIYFGHGWAALIVLGGAPGYYEAFKGRIKHLWNNHYADARRPIRKSGLLEIIFADDLNAWGKFESGSDHSSMVAAMANCQHELHKGGRQIRLVLTVVKKECIY